MGYGFMVWAVDIDALKRASGSQDDTLRRTIAERFASQLAQLNDIFEDAETSVDEALQTSSMGRSLKAQEAAHTLTPSSCLSSTSALFSTIAPSVHGTRLTSDLWIGPSKPWASPSGWRCSMITACQ
jgi:hypothetical protein